MMSSASQQPRGVAGSNELRSRPPRTHAKGLHAPRISHRIVLCHSLPFASMRCRCFGFVGLVFVLLTCCPLRTPSQEQPGHMRRWFDNLDSDKDGRLQQQELRQFIGANLGPTDYNTKKKLDAAVEQITGKLDGADNGLDISINELDQYLHTILKGVKVADWVAHSLGLPQYAQTFKDNAITVLDFPMLVNDGGKLLETELMVTRVLHRHKIMKAMQRQMLGLGAEPGPIQHLDCTAPSSSSSSSSSTGTAKLAVEINHTAGVTAATQQSVVVCAWQAPAALGEPALHKYVLERFALLQPGAKWESAAELDDNVITRFTDVVQQPGVYQYRLAAWNLYGRSAYVLSGEVSVEGHAGHDVQHVHKQAHMVSEKTPQQAPTGSAAPGAQLVLQNPLQLHTVATSGNAIQQHVPGLQQLKQQQWQQMPWDQQQNAFAGAADRSCASDTCWQCSEELPQAPLITVNSCSTAEAQRQDAGVAAAVAAAPNVVWVVGQGALSDGSAVPATAAAAIAQAQLLASMQAAAGKADAGGSSGGSSDNAAGVHKHSGVVGVLGGQLWRWIRACLNSLLLLVLPLLVRLLPVPVMNQLAAAAGQVARLLPRQLQQRLLQLAPSSRQAQRDAAASGAAVCMVSEIEPVESAAVISSSSAVSSSVQQQGTTIDRPAAAAAASKQVTPTEASLTVPSASASPMHALHHVASAPAVTALTPAAFGCLGQLPGDASALGLAASRSVGALQLGLQKGGSGLHKLQQRVAAADELTEGSAATAATGESMVYSSVSETGGSAAAEAAAAAAVGPREVHQSDAAGSVYSQASFEQCGLQLAEALEQQVPGKKRCAFPGCQQQFDLRHFKALRQRHYCGRCQQAFCLQHTAYSPHGASGSCGAESRCVCINCFHEFTPEYRTFLTMRNTLVQRRTSSGPPREGAVSSGGSSSDTAVGSEGRRGLRFVSSSASPGRLSKSVVTAAAGARRGAASSISGDVSQLAAQDDAADDGLRASSSSSRLDEMAKAAGSVMGKMLWARGLAKAKAVVRFKQAGQQHSR